MRYRFFILVSLCIALTFPVSVFAASPQFVYAAWLPYWKKASGTPEMLLHTDRIQELSPFSYDVEQDGTVKDTMHLAAEPWTTLFAKARTNNDKIIPTVSWIDGAAILAALSATSSRAAHVDDLVSMVKRKIGRAHV